MKLNVEAIGKALGRLNVSIGLEIISPLHKPHALFS
jgi:hypothetical protein